MKKATFPNWFKDEATMKSEMLKGLPCDRLTSDPPRPRSIHAIRNAGRLAINDRLNQTMKRLRLAPVLLSLIVMPLFARSAAAGASEGQYKLLALYSTEAVQFLKLGDKPDGRVTCLNGVLNTSEGASLYYAFSETTIVCQRSQDKASAHWIIHTQESRIGMAAEGHSFEADSQNFIASNCVYVEDRDVKADEDSGWECATYMALTQPFRVEFPKGSALDESGEVLFGVNLSKLKFLISPALND